MASWSIIACNQRRVIQQFGPDLKPVVTNGFPIDRVYVSDGRSWVILDVIPAVQQWTNGSWLTCLPCAAPATGFELTIRAVIRCGMGGDQPSGVSVFAQIHILPGDKSHFHQLCVGGQSIIQSRQEPITSGFEKLTTKNGFSLNWCYPGDVWGRLNLVAMVGPPTKVTFLPSNDPSIYAPQFERKFCLAARNQCLKTSTIEFQWTGQELAAVQFTAPNLKVATQELMFDATNVGCLLRRVNEQSKADLQMLAASTGKWRLRLNGWPSRGVLEAWNRHVVDPYILSLLTVDAGRQISSIPRIEAISGLDRASWAIATILCEQAPQGRDPRVLVCGATTYSITFEGASVDDDPESAGTSLMRISFPGLRTHTGVPLRAIAQLVKLQRSVANVPNDPSFSIQFRHRYLAQDSDVYQWVRGGAIDLLAPPIPARLSTTKPALDYCFLTGAHNPDVNTVHVEQFSEQDALRDALGETTSSVAMARLISAGDRVVEPGRPLVYLNIELGVRAIVPGGQDPTPDEPYGDAASKNPRWSVSNNVNEAIIAKRFHREQPVNVFDAQQWLQSSMDSSKSLPAFQWSFEERNDQSSSQSLSMRLAINSRWTSDLDTVNFPRSSVVVLDADPFLVAKVFSPMFAPVASRNGLREIANWNGQAVEGPRWEIHGISQGVDLLVPPQGVGEAMEKFQSTSGVNDVDEGKTVDFRFAPAGQLKIETSYFAQNSAEIPWNLRRLFGFPGQRDPGVAVPHLRAEWFYGMECRVDDPSLRVCELAALTGEWPTALPLSLPWRGISGKTPDQLGTEQQQTIFQQLRVNWSFLYAALRSRLGVLIPRHEFSITGLTIDDPAKVSYHLRRTAKLKFPVPGYDSTKLYEGKPGPTPFVKGENDNNADHGLAGGMTWGFEFAGLADELLERPHSEKGHLINPALSALGGWAQQKAVFCSGKTTIYADVAMGRTYRYSVERIGRVGVRWNRAKHVIVYERTTLRKDRFEGDQDELRGRPVLRKVEEYVEILEEKKSFAPPDAPQSAKVARGCLLATLFKSKRINVDSRNWGVQVTGPRPTAARDANGNLTQEIIALGYKFPLWNLDADPAFYPKPQVVDEFAADPDAVTTGSGTSGAFYQECDQPEKLYFYSSYLTVDLADQTDLWPPVVGVDYVPWQPPQPPVSPIDKDSNLDLPMPSAHDVELGFEAFTLRSIPTDMRANLSADRFQKATTARLNNVMPMRPPGIQFADQENLWLKFQSSVNDFKTTLENVGPKLVAKLPAILKGDPTQDLKTYVDSILNPLKKRFDDECDKLSKDIGKKCENLLSNLATEGLKQFRTVINQNIDALQKQLDDDIGRIQPSVTIKQLREQMLRAIDGGFEQATLLVSSVDPIPDQIARIVNTLRSRAMEPVAEIVTEVDYLESLIVQGTKAEEIKEYLSASKEKLAQLSEQLRTATDKIDKLLADIASSNWPAWKKDLDQQGVLATVSRAAASLKTVLGQIQGTVKDVQNAIATVINAKTSELAAAIKTLKTATTAVKDKIDAALKSDLGLNPDLGLKAVWDLCCGGQARVKGWLEASHDRVRSNVEGWAGTGSQDVTQKLQALQESYRAEFVKLKSIVGEIVVPTVSKQFLDQLCGTAYVEQIKDRATTLVGDVIKGVEQAAKSWQQLDGAKKVAEAWTKQFESVVGNGWKNLSGQLHELNEVANKVQGYLPAIQEKAGNALQLWRAFGERPAVPSLDFSRQKLGYYFQKAVTGDPGAIVNDLAVRYSPVVAWADRVGNDLKGLGVSLPTDALREKVDQLAGELPKFDLSKMIPDFGGIKLPGMFEGIKIPDNLKDNIKVQQGIDKQTQRAWLKADVNFALADRAILFSIGPIEVATIKPKFEAHSSVSAGISGGTEKSVTGIITSDWEICFGGSPIITFQQTTLRFDGSGKMTFNIDPKKIKVSGALDFVSSLLASLSSSQNGLLLRFLTEGSIPVGVQSLYALPLPDLQYGAFGMSNMSFAASFELMFLPKFSIGAGFQLSDRYSPFTITIFVLGGAGWIIITTRYHPDSDPTQRELMVIVSVAIALSASLGVTLGPISGTVSIYLGINLEFHKNLIGPASGQDNCLIRIFLLITGRVNVLGIITVSIILSLDATYDGNDGSLTGTGTVEISVKICWCLTIHVSSTVHMKFAGKDKKSEGSTHLQDRPAALLAHESPEPLFNPFRGEMRPVSMVRRMDQRDYVAKVQPIVEKFI